MIPWWPRYDAHDEWVGRWLDADDGQAIGHEGQDTAGHGVFRKADLRRWGTSRWPHTSPHEVRKNHHTPGVDTAEPALAGLSAPREQQSECDPIVAHERTHGCLPRRTPRRSAPSPRNSSAAGADNRQEARPASP